MHPGGPGPVSNAPRFQHPPQQWGQGNMGARPGGPPPGSRPPGPAPPVQRPPDQHPHHPHHPQPPPYVSEKLITLC